MKIVTFEGEQMHSLMTRIKSELGKDVMILKSEERSSGGYRVHVGLDPQGDKPYLPIDEMPVLTGHTDTPSSTEKDLLQSLSFESRLPFTKRIVALVGPTGVGKTTTIAKLAAQLSAACNIRIGLISIDSYRIGAGYQLHTYGKLLKIPCRVIHPKRPIAEEFEQSLHALRLCDLIFVDTAGCSPRDKERLELLASQCQMMGDVERILVLAAPTNKGDLLDTAKSFRKVGYNRLIFTKLDETGYLDPLVGAAKEIEKPLAFFTTGQRVPEDIEPASAKRLAWMLQEKMH